MNHVVSGQPNESAVPQQETDCQIASLRQQLQDCEIGLSTWDDGKNSEYWLRYPARAGEAVEEITSRLPREEQRSSPEWRPDPKTVEGWQPIETAPKDEREVIVFCPDNYPQVFTAAFVCGEWGCSVEDRCAPKDDFYGDSPKHPTYWMPLPAPPSELSGAITSGEEQSNAEAVVPKWMPDPKTVEAIIAAVEEFPTSVSLHQNASHAAVATGTKHGVISVIRSLLSHPSAMGAVRTDNCSETSVPLTREK